MTSTEDQFLLGGGGSSAKFENVGDSVTGTVISTAVTDQTHLQTGQPLKWDDGSVRKQLVVKLQTAERNGTDDEGVEDDGIRGVYVKGAKKPGSQSLHDAVASAVRAAGAKSLEAGGTLTVTLIGSEPSKTVGFNPRKLYSATYQPPNQSAGFLGTGSAAPSVPPIQPPAAPAPPGLTPEQAAAFQAWTTSQQATPAPF